LYGRKISISKFLQKKSHSITCLEVKQSEVSFEMAGEEYGKAATFPAGNVAG
jgi:hypothetical protein